MKRVMLAIIVLVISAAVVILLQPECQTGSERACTTGMSGPCAAGVQSCVDGTWQSCEPLRTPRQEFCNKIDDNCNGIIDDNCWQCQPGDEKRCGVTDVGRCTLGMQTCGKGRWGHCEGAINPTREVCFNDIDDNCDGSVDEDCGVCAPGERKRCGDTDKGACAYGEETCGDDGQWGDCIGLIKPIPEICNGKDDDCDGIIDEGCGVCTSGDTRACPKQDGVCTNSKQTCVSGQWDACDYSAHSAAYESNEITCDNKDNDCDGIIDEGLTQTYYRDNDADGYGDANQSQQACTQLKQHVIDDSDCDDHDHLVNPGQTENCATIVDDNCNGQINEGCGAAVSHCNNNGVCDEYAVTLGEGQPYSFTYNGITHNGMLDQVVDTDTALLQLDGSDAPIDLMTDHTYNPGTPEEVHVWISDIIHIPAGPGDSIYAHFGETLATCPSDC